MSAGLQAGQKTDHSDSTRKSSISIELGGKSLGFGLTYERKFHFKPNFTLSVGTGAAFSVLTMHYFTVPVIARAEFGNRKIRPVLGAAVSFGIGNEMKHGYSNSIDFYREECSGVGCAPWFPKVTYHYIGELGVRWYQSNMHSFIICYSPSLIYNRFRTGYSSSSHRFFHSAVIGYSRSF